MGGRKYLVTKRRLWYENKLRSVFGGVRVRQIDSYFMSYESNSLVMFHGGLELTKVSMRPNL